MAGLVLGVGSSFAAPMLAAAQEAPATQPAPDPARDAEARSLFQRGDLAYTEGRYEAALALFEEAYALSQRPALLYNLANALEHLGRTQEAIDRLRAFLDHTAAEQRPVVERRIEALEARLARREREETERERAERERIEAELGAHRDPPVVLEGRTPWAAIGLYTAGALLAGGGLILGAVAQSTNDTALRECTTDRVCPSSVSADLDLGKTLALSADVTFGVAAALGIVGTVFLVIDLSAAPTPRVIEQAPASSAPTVALRISPTSVGLTGTF